VSSEECGSPRPEASEVGPTRSDVATWTWPPKSHFVSKVAAELKPFAWRQRKGRCLAVTG
jgi:hypothetical protein